MGSSCIKPILSTITSGSTSGSKAYTSGSTSLVLSSSNIPIIEFENFAYPFHVVLKFSLQNKPCYKIYIWRPCSFFNFCWKWMVFTSSKVFKWWFLTWVCKLSFRKNFSPQSSHSKESVKHVFWCVLLNENCYWMF